MAYLIIFIVIGLLACIPAAIAESRGRSFGLWWVFGFLLLIVALPCSLFLSTTQARRDELALQQGGRRCPACAEIVRADAKLCRFCSTPLT